MFYGSQIFFLKMEVRILTFTLQRSYFIVIISKHVDSIIVLPSKSMVMLKPPPPFIHLQGIAVFAPRSKWGDVRDLDENSITGVTASGTKPSLENAEKTDFDLF